MSHPLNVAGPDPANVRTDDNTANPEQVRLAGSQTQTPRFITAVANYVRVLRVHQWFKNGLLLVPMLSAHALSVANLIQMGWAVAAFCLTASAAYILNDLNDLEADRHHRSKRKRPLASGAVPLAHGRILALALFAAGGGVATALSPAFAMMLGLYVAIAVAYTVALKRVAVVDVLTLAGLYALRVIAGGVALNIAVSHWLLAFSLFLFLSLALLKRHTELVGLLSDTATTDSDDDPIRMIPGRGYRHDDLLLLLMLCAVSGYAAVVVLALYVTSSAVVPLYTHPDGLLCVCVLLLYWITRVLLISHRGEMHDDPVLFLLKDRASLLVLALTFITVVASAL
jgi:4-hydroxybenzoate polyprenyltransferase